MFMKSPVNCPFAAVDRVLSALPPDVKIIVVDMHAEATSEKIAMGWHLDGRASVLFGTHTHVPTADERILPHGTAYITDLGMTGPYDSVLGRDKGRVVGAMISGVPNTFDIAVGDVRLCGVVVSVETETGRAASIERVCYQADAETE
jgi:metallophosphoesterase (TIGR00282 family)